MPLAGKDVISHILNGQCASLKSPGCSEVAHKVQSPIRIALTVTEALVVRCERGRVSLDELHTYCTAIGVTTDQRPEFTALIVSSIRPRIPLMIACLACSVIVLPLYKS